MSWCVVKGCKSRNGTTRRENTNELVTFHLFPKDEAAKDIWVKILSRHNWAPKKHSRICSKHFAVDSFVPNDNLKYRRLKANVIPTLYLSDETNINKINDTGPSDTIFHFQAPHQNYKVDSYCEKSNEEEVCRVCLATDVKMFNLQSGTLKHCIESIYGFRDLLVKKELPKVVCYECSMHIIKYYKLIEKSIISQATLLDILNENGNITKSLIKEIDRKQLNLQSSLALNQTLVMECNDLNEENISNFYRSDHDYHLQEDEMNINKNTILVYEQTSKGNKTSQFKNLLLNETKDSDSIQNITIESELNEDCDQSADTHSNLNEEDETESSYNVYYENIIKMDLCPEDASITVDERSTVPRDNIVKKSVTKRRMKNAVTKKEEEREITPDELAIEKLRSSYNIVELTIQEQMEGWQKEVGLPPRTPRWQHGKVFECKVCSKKFPKKLNFDRHTARHNAICGAFQCQICKERFLNQKRLNAHTLRTHSYRYECQNCPKVFSNVDQAMRHAPAHEGRVFSCPFCDYSSPARSSAWAHVRTRHAHAQHCALCGQSFVSEKGLALHHNLVHAGQAKEPQGKFPCEDCDTVFNSEGALRIHLNTSMQHKGLVSARDPAMKRTCVRCAATCASALELHAHMRREHGRVDPPARPGVYSYPRRCDHCDMEMNSRQDHWRHVLKEHKEMRHLYKPKVAAMCDQCGKTLQSQMHLRLHMLRHGSPGYPCSMCSRQYYDTYALQRHVDTYHSSEKRHVCEQCGAGFKSRSNLTRHMLLHSEETPYSCRSCDKKFKYSNSLKLHVKHVHQKEPWPLRVRGKRAVKSAVVEEDN